MMGLTPGMILLVAALALWVVHWWRPSFAYAWLLAAGAGLLAWLLTLILWILLPVAPTSLTWPLQTATATMAFVWDSFSRAFTLALTSLALAALLVDVSRAPLRDWWAWSAILVYAAGALVAVQAASLFALLVALTALDLVDLASGLLRASLPDTGQRAIIGFGLRTLGTGFVLLASVLGGVGLAQSTAGNPSLVTLLFYVGTLLRLGLYPTRVFSPGSPSSSRAMNAITGLALAAGGLALLGRTSGVAAVLPDQGVLALALAVPGLLGSLAWLTAEDDLAMLPAWILGSGSLALAAHMRGQFDASLAWGMASLLTAGVLTLAYQRTGLARFFIIIGLWGASGLPFSPTYTTASTFAAPIQPAFFLFILTHALLLAGYGRHMLRPGLPTGSTERWERLIYPLGLAILPLAAVLVGWLPWPGSEALVGNPLWPGPVALAVGLLFWLGARDGRVMDSLRAGNGAVRAFLMPVVQAARALLWLIGRGLAFLEFVLEGEGGVLWALLFLTLLLSLLTQIDLTAFLNGS